MPDRVVYEMTISHADFFRTLPAALSNASYEVQGSEIVAGDGQRKVTISLSAESTRAFGPIPLPVTHVEVEFEGYSARERDRFLERFHHHYRRGGG